MLYPLSLLAGILTALSPCVLPALPIIVGSASGRHRLAPVAVCAGLTASFTILGVILSQAGHVVGINETAIRYASATLIILFGVVMINTQLKNRLTGLLNPLAQSASSKASTGQFEGLKGQFLLGCLLGAVWSPCVGPTLGAAIGMASQSSSMWQAGTMMLLFGIGASLPLLFVAYSSRELFSKIKGNIIATGQKTQRVFAIILIAVGMFILLGLDKTLEAWMLGILPDFWIDWITRF